MESFSKTHGICGERIGSFSSVNKELFTPVQSLNMQFAAGNGRYLSSLALAIAESSPEEEAVIRKLHKHWAQEKEGLYYYLLASGKFPHLFDENQRHIQPEKLKEPRGLYLFVKLKDGVDQKRVLRETGCLGVLTPMKSGMYLRLAVGKIKKPTYAKYIPGWQEEG